VLAASLALAVAAVVVPAAIPHAPGERMDYSVSYLGMHMGKARLSVGRVEGEILPVFLETRTTGVMSVVDLRQQLASYLDVETGLPRRTSIDAVEAGYRHTDTTQFDRAAGKASVREKGKFDNTYEVEVPPETVDFVALVFRLRTMPLEPGGRVAFPVLAGKRLANVVVEVVGRERVSTGAGDFDAVKVRVPTGFSGRFSEKNPTYVWFTDDARRIVVQISTDFSIGRAIAGLVAYHPGARVD
jgi:hypothetical protein